MTAALDLLHGSWATVENCLFVDNLFAQHLVHKTVLSVLSWLAFGALLSSVIFGLIWIRVSPEAAFLAGAGACLRDIQGWRFGPML